MYLTSPLFQNVSFFDREPVGNLTSRLGADCQKLSHIISNNFHMIVRYSLQVDSFIKSSFVLISLIYFHPRNLYESKILRGLGH